MATIEQLEARLTELEQRLPPAPSLQANPPVTIGELADVPAPGSAIASAWAQEVTRRTMHRFATVAARDAAYPAAAAGPGALCVTTAAPQREWVVIGTAWVPLADWATPAGYVAASALAGSQVTPGAGAYDALVGTPVNWTKVANRRYKALFEATVQQGNAGSGTTLALQSQDDSTLYVELGVTLGANYMGSFSGFHLFAPGALSSPTTRLVIKTQVPPVTTTMARLTIEDIGGV